MLNGVYRQLPNQSDAFGHNFHDFHLHACEPLGHTQRGQHADGSTTEYPHRSRSRG